MAQAAAAAAPQQLQSPAHQLLYSAVAHPQTGHGPQMLGSGGFGSVFKYSFNNSVGQREFVAIKRMKLTGLPQAEAQELDRTIPRELGIHHRLNHPHIARMRDAFLSDDQGHTYLNIVMDFIQGGTLIQYVNAHRPVSEETTRWFFQQLVVTLDYLHAQDVSHRDIKLENALAQPVPGLPLPLMKIVDFGLSRTGVLADTLVGTAEYKAPELFPQDPDNPAAPNHHQYVTSAVDVWSAGVLLYAVLNMAYPWPREWPAAQRWQAMHARPLQHPRQDLSADCKDLLEQMLDPDPALRITVEGIMQHPWFREGLDPALLALKAAAMGLPSPCEYTLPPAKLAKLVAQVHHILQGQMMQQQQVSVQQQLAGVVAN